MAFPLYVVSESVRHFESGDRKSFICVCHKCGTQYNLLKSDIKKGCRRCNSENAKSEYIEHLRNNFIGKKFGKYTIQDVEMDSNAHVAMTICKCECGHVSYVSLYNIKNGLISGCRKCDHYRDGLEIGRLSLTSEAKAHGTNVMLVNTNVVKKSNSTGINGVSRLPYGRYRAYITFRRKQYYLGTFASLDEAADARKKAEEKFFVEFRKEYEDGKK